MKKCEKSKKKAEKHLFKTAKIWLEIVIHA